MGSLVMHLCVAKKLQEKYKFSDKFVIGELKPDLLKFVGKSKFSTHYIDTIIENSGVKHLPNILKYEQENVDSLKDELTLGYMSHLIQDKIWFDKYIGKYVKKDASNTDTVYYLASNTIKTDQEFSKDIYNDYYNLNSYLSNKYDIDIDKIKKELIEICPNDEVKCQIKNCFRHKNVDIDTKNVFITKEDIDLYIKEAFNISSMQIDKILKS